MSLKERIFVSFHFYDLCPRCTGTHISESPFLIFRLASQKMAEKSLTFQTAKKKTKSKALRQKSQKHCQKIAEKKRGKIFGARHKNPSVATFSKSQHFRDIFDFQIF